MKLLIVDDEKLTRSGLIGSIDWDALGIDEVLEASNGSEGIRLASTERPDIILTDMRMPRMDGVTMARKVRESLPDSAIVFMSGYSDKEYLKAAIDLKAVSYVEKPLDPKEVSDAVKMAMDELTAKGLVKRGLTASLKEHENRLAELMTRPSSAETFEGAILPEPMRSDDYFTSVILQFASSYTPSVSDLYNIAESELPALLKPYRLNEIHLMKENNCLCFFLYGNKVSHGEMVKLCEKLQKPYSSSGLKYVALGDTFHGISKAYNSYTSAVILLQGGFFDKPGSVLANEEDASPAPPIINDCSAEYLESLSSGNKDMAEKVLNDVHSQFAPPCRLLVSQVKDIYYQLFLTLQKAARQSQTSEVLLKGHSSIWDMVEHADTLDILHDELVNLTNEYFDTLSSRDTGSSMVFTIKEFIRQNYQNESLSIKSVSDHVNRSAPYVCTFFKAETGLTLNQYITGYRIERAQEMLADPRYKITDVASRVGYTDVNYFGKTFKKITGVSPSEFRNNLGNHNGQTV